MTEEPVSGSEKIVFQCVGKGGVCVQDDPIDLYAGIGQSRLQAPLQLWQEDTPEDENKMVTKFDY